MGLVLYAPAGLCLGMGLFLNSRHVPKHFFNALYTIAAIFAVLAIMAAPLFLIGLYPSIFFFCIGLYRWTKSNLHWMTGFFFSLSCVAAFVAAYLIPIDFSSLHKMLSFSGFIDQAAITAYTITHFCLWLL